MQDKRDDRVDCLMVFVGGKVTVNFSSRVIFGGIERSKTDSERK